ncbi:hypothetical protein [Amygdalobacter nucleatus]|nr:hypothetical protein [Amygdalobacter nucleatus]MDF0486298.1 hypothetical protein [Amygdalobacter nucleatus]
MSGKFDAKYCLNLYEIFQYALEFYMPGIDSLYIKLYMDENAPVLSIKIKGAKPKSFLDKYKDTYSKDDILIDEDIVDDEINLCISLGRR